MKKASDLSLRERLLGKRASGNGGGWGFLTGGKSSSSWMVFALCFADFGNLVFNVGPFWVNALAGKWAAGRTGCLVSQVTAVPSFSDHGRQQAHWWLCQTTSFADLMFGFASVFTVAAIAVEVNKNPVSDN